MPTIVLLDRSLSMRRPASRDKSGDTRHSLACKGLQWFFDYMGLCFPLEYTTLLSFSSSCEVLAPFTRDYSLLSSKLEEVAMQDRTDLHTALVAMVEIMVGEWGAFAPCQAVLVTDGAPGVRHQDAVHKKQLLNIPFPCRLHIVCIAVREELIQPASASRMERLCEVTGVTPTEVFVPPSPLGVSTVKETFKQLARTYLKPYSGILKCGHLHSPIGLCPPPSVLRSNLNISVTGEYRFPRLDEEYPDLQYPQELVICGFFDISSLPVPPIYTRHFVVDHEVEMKTVESMLQSSGGRTEVLSPREWKHDVAEESSKPSFRVLLHGSLKCESKAALAKLGTLNLFSSPTASDNWFGLLFSATSSTKKSNLVLSVFYPNSEFPWLGPLPYLGPKPVSIVDPRVSAGENEPFPVYPPHNPSFQTPANLLWASEPVLQSDVTKVIRYSRKLPDKEVSLVKELNKLRVIALTFSMPELLEMLCSILSKEESTATHPQAKTLLQQCAFFLSSNKNPQERLAVTHGQI